MTGKIENYLRNTAYVGLAEAEDGAKERSKAIEAG